MSFKYVRNINFFINAIKKKARKHIYEKHTVLKKYVFLTCYGLRANFLEAIIGTQEIFIHRKKKKKKPID